MRGVGAKPARGYAELIVEGVGDCRTGSCSYGDCDIDREAIRVVAQRHLTTAIAEERQALVEIIREVVFMHGDRGVTFVIDQIVKRLKDRPV